jgi:hypothetical protein
MRSARRFGLAAAVVSLLLPASASAQESPLAQVPEQAVVVIHLHGFGRTKDRLVALAKNAAPDLAPVLERQIDQGLEKALDGRKLQGLPPDGAIFLVLLEMPAPGDNEPQAAVIARVTRYADFRDGILKDDERKSLKKEGGYEVATTENGKQVYFMDRQDYVIVTPRKDVAARLSKKPDRGLDTKLHKDDARHLLEPDAAFYVDMAAVNEAYGPMIRQFRGQLDAILPLLAGQGNESYVELFKSMSGSLFQALTDSRAALVSVDLRPQGVALHAQVRVGADTPTNTALKKFPVTDLKQLESLPAGSMIYTATEVNAALLKTFQPLMYGVLTKGTGVDPKSLQEALDDLAAAKPQMSVAAMNLPVRGIQVWKYADPAKAMEAQRKLLESLPSGGSYQFTVLKDKPEIKVDERSHRDFKLTRAKFTWDLDKLSQGVPGGGQAMTDAMKKLMGEGLTVWFGTDGKTYVQISGKDWPEARRYLDAYLDGKETLGQQAAFLDARKHLPGRTTMLVMMDLPQYARALGQIFLAMMRGQAGAEADEQPAAIKSKASYLGMAITLRPEVGSFDLWLPGSVVGEVRKVFEGFRGGGP